MYTVKQIKSADMFPLVRELLKSGQHVRITVTGASMYPFLHENSDSVELQKVQCQTVRRGDIVLFVRENGSYVLHRVKGIKNGQFFMLGDNQKDVEGPIDSEQLVAAVNAVFRNGRRIDCQNTGWRVLSLLWLGIVPFRGRINRILRKLGV